MRALLVPVKSFRSAKVRLAPVLSPDERAELSQELALGVLAAAGKLDPFVVCDDAEVAAWARAAGAEVVWTPGLGLSGAVAAGVDELAARGFELVVVAHSDLPYAEDLDEVGLMGSITLVPDLAEDGTNVVIVPSQVRFRFSYGRGSFDRHRAEAVRLKLPCVVVHDRRLAVDVDLPEDLARWQQSKAGSARETGSPLP